MKSLLPTLIICISFLCLSSCSKDDNVDDNGVLGTYTLNSLKVDTAVDLDNDGISENILDPGCLKDSELRLDSQSSGSLFFTSDVAYNTMLENDRLEFATICAFNQDLDETIFDYSLNDNTLSVNFNGNSYLAIISGSMISLTIPNGFIARDVETFETTISQDLTYVFKMN